VSRRKAVNVLEDQNKSCPRVNGERLIAANGIIKCTKGRSAGHVRNDSAVPSQVSNRSKKLDKKFLMLQKPSTIRQVCQLQLSS